MLVDVSIQPLTRAESVLPRDRLEVPGLFVISINWQDLNPNLRTGQDRLSRDHGIDRRPRRREATEITSEARDCQNIQEECQADTSVNGVEGL